MSSVPQPIGSAWAAALPADPTAPRTTSEFRLQAEVRDRRLAYVRYRDAGGFHALALTPTPTPLYVGRDPQCVVAIQADDRISRRHARLTFGAGRWSIEDGPSRNGTFIAGRRLTREELLSDGSTFTVGGTLISFHMPPMAVVASTVNDDPKQLSRHPLSPRQRKVLRELVRPFVASGGDVATIPTNLAIARALGYEVTTIRDTISDLYRQGGLVRGEANQRQALVLMALRERVALDAPG